MVRGEDSVSFGLPRLGIPTGMGKVHREIGRGLKKRGYDVVSLGWFNAPWLEDWREWKVYKTYNQYYGGDVFDEVIAQEGPDIVLTVGDPWMVGHIADMGKCKTRFSFQWVMYVPIDGEVYGGGLPPSWLGVFNDADYIVAYTEFGKNAILKSIPDAISRLCVIPHGVDLNVYRRYSKESILRLRREANISDETVVFLYVARNQFRKNIPEFCKAWKIFRKNERFRNAMFWPHMAFKDQMGWNLKDVFEAYDMKKDLLYFKEVAESKSNLHLVSEKQLTTLYNMVDVVVMIAGEGFGLPTLEGMACGKPVLALNHSANIELVQGRGELVDVGCYITGSHSTERPIPNLTDLANKLAKLCSNPKLREEYGEKSYKFAQTLSWDAAVEKWDRLLKRVDEPFSVKEVAAERIV